MSHGHGGFIEPLMELVWSFHRPHKFQNQTRHTRFFGIVRLNSVVVCHGTFAGAVAVKGRPTLKRNGKSQDGNVDTLCREGLLKQALSQRVIPAGSDVASLLQACTNVAAVKQVHAHIFRAEFEQNIFLVTKLLSTYAMHGSVENARLVFDKICSPEVILWNAMIREYARNGPCEEAIILYNEMQRVGVKPDNFTFPFVLKACGALAALQEGKDIHDHIARTGFESDVFVGTALIDMYAKCGSIHVARHVFDKMSKRNLVSWNAMIVGCVQNGQANEALTLFYQMLARDMKPDSVTMASVLSACANLAALHLGKCIHGYVIRTGFVSNYCVVNSLMDMYAKCGSIDIAYQLFEKMVERDVVSWNAMIVGCTQNGYANEALALFNQMQLADVRPNSVTMASMLQACAHLGALNKGMWIHDYVIQKGFESDVTVGNSLVAMYAKCGRVEVACQIFDKMSNKNVVSWSAMIAGYIQSGNSNEALTLFHQMQHAGIMPNSITVMSVLQACAHLAALQQGRCIHGNIIQSGLESDVAVGTSLVDMYAKCGSIEIARKTFDKMAERNVLSWSAMIAGYGMHGHGESALQLFSQMQQTDIEPNHITFVCVLSACSHAGLVDEGLRFFDCMIKDYYIMPKVEHYACMVDILGRAGCLDEAQDFIEKMPLEPSASVWGALLSACRIHCNIELGECVAERLFKLEPEKAGTYVLLSNIYASAGRWDDVAKVRAMMKERGVKKTPGCSLIEVNNRVHAFLVGDRSHHESEKIYATLEKLAGQMEEAGYMPDMNIVLHNVEE